MRVSSFSGNRLFFFFAERADGGFLFQRVLSVSGCHDGLSDDRLCFWEIVIMIIRVSYIPTTTAVCE